jgi:ClpP class serine protease
LDRQKVERSKELGSPAVVVAAGKSNRKETCKMNEVWAAEPNRLQRYLELVENANSEQQAAALSAYPANGGASCYQVNGDTAQIFICGVLRKVASPLALYLGLGGSTYAGIIEACEAIKALDGVKKVILVCDSPGGHVDGLDEAWQAMADLAKSKTVIAEVRGTCASAAYWLASASSRIESSAPSNMIGSIGVIVVSTSFKNMDEKLGIREVIIRSKNAQNKNPEADSKEGREILQGQVNALERIFHQRIAEGRGVSAETVAERFGKGALFVSQDPDPDEPDAIKAGLIDSLAPSLVQHTYGNQLKSKKEKEMLTKEQIEKCVAVLQGEWPQAIKDMAGRVLAGGVEPSSLEIACATYDANKPEGKREDAVVGLVNDEANLQAQIASGRVRLGLGKAGV